MPEQTIRIDGMSCGHCVARVRKALEGVAGLTVLDLTVGEARVQTEPDLVEEETIRRVLIDAGYQLVDAKVL